MVLFSISDLAGKKGLEIIPREFDGEKGGWERIVGGVEKPEKGDARISLKSIPTSPIH
jgi:hypothetical protein